MLNPLHDPGHRVGTVIEVAACLVKVDLPNARAPSSLHNGSRIAGGEVGELVAIEHGHLAVIGRVIRVGVSEKDRLRVPERLGEQSAVHPVGLVELLGTFDGDTRRLTQSVTRHPRVGSAVYSLGGAQLKALLDGQLAESRCAVQAPDVLLNLGAIASGEPVSFPVEALLARHCAVLGATGGGKSWTIAKIVEELLARTNAKTLVLDPTGEFATLGVDRHLRVGEDASEPDAVEAARFTYRDMVVQDIFCLLRPGPQVQATKLREAIRSLRLVELEPRLQTHGTLQKRATSRANFAEAIARNAEGLRDDRCSFDINYLVDQIQAECIWPSSRSTPSCFGDPDQGAEGHCVSLINRIEILLGSPELSFLFRAPASAGTLSLPEALEQLATDDRLSCLRLDLSGIPADYDARPIITNALGRHLLLMARQRRFSLTPLVVVLDEAHQFLGRVVGDQYTEQRLDQFELIAKEGRKYGLHLCVATQRPRDLTDQVLSQMGTLIVHRLTNAADREVVDRASSEAGRSATAFVPQLAQGEAILLGSSFNLPVPIHITPPNSRPKPMSSGFRPKLSRTEF